MRHDLERSWDADDAYRALHPQEGDEAIQQPTTSTLIIRSALLALLMMGVVAFATVWWLEASDCGDHSTWSCGL